MDNFRRRTQSGGFNPDPVTGIGMLDGHEAVDLRLPSGLLWATDDSGWYQWGWGLPLTSLGDAGNDTYVGANTFPNDYEHDGATHDFGSGWRTPDAWEFDELMRSVYPVYENSNWLYCRYNQPYRKIGNFVKSGYVLNGTQYNIGTAYYWVNGGGSYYSAMSVCPSYDATNIYTSETLRKICWCCVRPVHDPITEVVRPIDGIDLGLPSGNLWASSNIGASSEHEYGLYFSWGNTDGHSGSDGYTFTLDNYSNTTGYSLTSNINSADVSQDAARTYRGGAWRMPTRDEADELVNNTDAEWISNYNSTGVAGVKFMKKTDHSVFIFIPAAGCYTSNGNTRLGTECRYWTTLSNGSSAGILRATTNLATLNGRAGLQKSYGIPIRPVISP